LGCRRFNNLFWQVPVPRLEDVVSYHELRDLVVLKRSRNLIRQSVNCDGDTVELCSFVVIAYKSRATSKKTRKIIQRALQRAPYFKLCPSVYAFPQLRKPKAVEYRTEVQHHDKKRKVTTPGEFFDILNGLDCNVLALPRMVVMNSSMCRILIERMKTTRRVQCRKLIQTCKDISSHIRFHGEDASSKALRLKLSEVKYRYRAIRAVLSFFKKQMNIDMSKELVRVSKAIGSCLQTFRQAEEIRAIALAKSVS
jgi:ribosomal protein S15P/S13E